MTDHPASARFLLMDGEEVAVTQRFWAKVEKTSGCWIWHGTRTGGYGNFRLRGRECVRAHRVAYELLVGPVAEGLELDHLCRVRRCVNPAHLEPVSKRENILRGESFSAVYARRTHCKHGHEFTPANTRIRKSGGGRACVECGRYCNRALYQRAYRARRREAA